MDDLTRRVPPHVFFFISAVFHYLGPAFAVLLFAHVDVLGVMWLRIATAAVVFAAWRRPWRIVRLMPRTQRWSLLALGIVLGLMNSCFYEAIARLPLGTVAAIEFVGPVVLAAAGLRTRRNLAAFALAISGAWLLTHARFAGELAGYTFAFANALLFVLYIVLGHRLARDGAAAGVDRLGAAMLVAMIATLPIGFREALPAFIRPQLLLAGIGVGISSSVIPYVCDQLAMARLPRATFALLLSLLPASSTLIGIIVLHQLPSMTDLAGIGLVAVGVALHQAREFEEQRSSCAYAIAAHLSDRIGARPAGSANAALAVEWTTQQFREWGIEVRNERVMVPRWIRGEEHARIVSHNDQPLVLTTLGGSVATSELTADVIEINSFEELHDAVAGRIVFFNAAIDQSLVDRGEALRAYGDVAMFRIDGARRAAAFGAVAVLVRSTGTGVLRAPHTGSVNASAIPAAALAAEDAMLLHRLLASGDRVVVQLTVTPSMLPEVESANVVAEIRGRECPDEIVLIGAHLDSWDLGTGAIDNASGVAMVMETMRLIAQRRDPPRRTIRCVLFMNEELGQHGSRAYFAAHGHEQHVAAIESDLGAGAPIGFSTTLSGDALRALRKRIAPLQLTTQPSTGVDTRPLTMAGVPGFGYAPDMRRYFDYHHTAADTLDKIDPSELAAGAAAVAKLTWVLSGTIAS